MVVHGITFHLCLGVTGMTEEENFIRLMQYFAQYTEYSADRIEEVVHEIMDNPTIYKEYFN